MYSYDNTDGHMTCDVPGYSPPKNKGVFTLKQFFKLVLPHSQLSHWIKATVMAFEITT